MAYVIDQKNCSCCHRCRMECPADAIRFKHAKYWIDPEKCIECGSCQTVCHNGAIAGPGPADTAAPHELTRLTCDVCVQCYIFLRKTGADTYLIMLNFSPKAHVRIIL